jgi:segregation and condensation protein A
MADETLSDATVDERSGGTEADDAAETLAETASSVEAAASANAAVAVDEKIEPVGEMLVLQPGPVAREAETKRATAAAAKDAAQQEEASLSPFSVTVGQLYDGPLDLLLDLIRKQNIDIYDIPIALITAQFLDYCHQLRQTDVDSAGEFIYMASLLIHIKSKTLLPRDPSDVAGGDSEDPRRELVERLLEHERFKAAAQMLMQKQQIEEATWSNPGMRSFMREETGGDEAGDGAEQEIAADAVDLVRVFQEVLERLRERPVLDVDEESVTVAQMIDYVKRRLMMEERPVSLRRMLHTTHSERALICMFLAMLELVRLQAVLLHQPNQLGDILIKKAEGFDEVFAGEASARDDWR